MTSSPDPTTDIGADAAAPTNFGRPVCFHLRPDGEVVLVFTRRVISFFAAPASVPADDRDEYDALRRDLIGMLAGLTTDRAIEAGVTYVAAASGDDEFVVAGP